MSDQKMWGGRFGSSIDPRFQAFNESFSFDHELLRDDIEGSLAWCEALADAGAISPEESEKINSALQQVQEETTADSLGAAVMSGKFEDIHSYVESKLREKIGDLAGKLHTGRSRNDQVATDFKVYLQGAIAEAHRDILSMAEALAVRGEKESGTAMPGYTHLQRAEPVTFGHWCLAYAEMLLRDADRFRCAAARGDECPLGSGALSGTPLPIDRDKLAARLCFARATANSLDAVSDRDLLIDYMHASTLLLIHLSRMSEDLILYASSEFGFVVLPDALATGSSRMPQKKNPDLLELTRGHAGRAIGELTGLLAILKGLPMAYNKDLQLDKEPAFRMRKTLGFVLPLLGSLIESLDLNRSEMRNAATSDALLATELADAIAARGVPFRTAHEIVGRAVAAAGGREGAILTIETDEISKDDMKALDLDRALARRDVAGGTAPDRVAAAARTVLERVRIARGS